MTAGRPLAARSERRRAGELKSSEAGRRVDVLVVLIVIVGVRYGWLGSGRWITLDPKELSPFTSDPVVRAAEAEKSIVRSRAIE